MQDTKKHFDIIFNDVSRKENNILKINVKYLQTAQIEHLSIFSNRVKVKDVFIKRSGNGLLIIAELV